MRRLDPFNDSDLLNLFEAHQSFMSYATLAALRKKRDRLRKMLDQRDRYYRDVSYGEAYMIAHHECILAWLNAEIARRIWANPLVQSRMVDRAGQL